MPFQDLLLPNAEVVAGEYFPYTLDSSLHIPLSIEDTNGSLMSLASGYTATLTLNMPDDTNVLTFTQALVGGRIINLNPGPDASLIVQSTPAGMAALEPHVRRALAFNLIVTRTSDGLAVDVMRDCFLVPQPDHD